MYTAHCDIVPKSVFKLPELYIKICISFFDCVIKYLRIIHFSCFLFGQKKIIGYICSHKAISKTKIL